MKSTLITFLLIALYIVPLHAQDTLIQNKNVIIENDSVVLRRNYMEENTQKILTYEYSFWGIRTFSGRKHLSNREVRNFLQRDPEALDLYNRGRSTLIGGTILAATGAFAFGYGLFATVNAYGENYGFTSSDKTLGYTLIGAGIVAAAGGVVLFFNGQRKMKLGIDNYNNGLLTSSVEFGFTPNGLGLLVQF